MSRVRSSFNFQLCISIKGTCLFFPLQIVSKIMYGWIFNLLSYNTGISSNMWRLSLTCYSRDTYLHFTEKLFIEFCVGTNTVQILNSIRLEKFQKCHSMIGAGAFPSFPFSDQIYLFKLESFHDEFIQKFSTPDVTLSAIYVTIVYNLCSCINSVEKLSNSDYDKKFV